MKLVPAIANPRHARVTIAFDGTAGNGAVGTVDLFTITGRVWVVGLAAFCTEDLTEGGATATAEVGSAGDTTELLGQIDATTLDSGDWWTGAAATPADSGQMNATSVDVLLAADIILTVGSQAISNGTIVFDVFYIPLTDNGVLA